MPSLKQLIYDRIKNSPKPVTRPEIEELAIASGYNASNGVRRSQELCQTGQIERVPGRYASYTAVRIIENDTERSGLLHQVELADVHQGVERTEGGQADLFPNLRRKTFMETSSF